MTSTHTHMHTPLSHCLDWLANEPLTLVGMEKVHYYDNQNASAKQTSIIVLGQVVGC